MTQKPLLEIEDLKTVFPSDFGMVRAVDGVSFNINSGERLGIVGESGSGKSVTALSIMGLVPRPPGQVTGKALFRDTDLLTLKRRQWQGIRGAKIAMIFQDPLNCLNPAMTIGDQIAEGIRAHFGASRSEARRRAVESLARVGIPSPARSADEYPHRFSGGMRQRVMIAMALACEPELVIADEPTTALDVTIQAQIVELLATVCEELGTAVMLITHDLALLAGFAHRVVVMYGGKVVEEGPVDTVYYGASHPYTWGLMTSITRLDEERRDRLVPIPGVPPSATFPPGGCSFHPRCSHAEGVCRDEVPPLEIRPGENHPCACHFAGRLTAPPALSQAQE